MYGQCTQKQQQQQQQKQTMTGVHPWLQQVPKTETALSRWIATDRRWIR